MANFHLQQRVCQELRNNFYTGLPSREAAIGCLVHDSEFMLSILQI